MRRDSPVDGDRVFLVVTVPIVVLTDRACHEVSLIRQVDSIDVNVDVGIGVRGLCYRTGKNLGGIVGNVDPSFYSFNPECLHPILPRLREYFTHVDVPPCVRAVCAVGSVTYAQTKLDV